MSSSQSHQENENYRGPLTEDVHISIVGGPAEYSRRPEGPVHYIAYGNPAGPLGYLWMAADGSDNAGSIPSPAQGYRASNSRVFWIECMREAKAKGMTPLEALTWLRDSRAGEMPFPGRVILRSVGEAESLDALRTQVKSEPEINTEDLPYLRIHVQSQLIFEPNDWMRLLVPNITDDMRESTELAPGKRMVAVDPEYPLFSQLQDEGIVGYWQTHEDGKFEEFTRNPRYKPTPTGVGMRKAESRLERAAQLRLLTRLSEEAFVKELRSSQVLVPVHENQHTPRPWTPDEPGAAALLLMYTAPFHAPDEGRNCRWMNAAEAAGLMTNLTIEINRGSGAGISIPASKVAVSDFG